MLSGFRAFAQTWYAKVFLVLMGLGLVSISFSGRFAGVASDAVVRAGSHEVSSNDYKRIFQGALQDAEKQAGQQVTNQDAVQAGFDRHILDEIAGDEASAELISRLGLRAPASQIIDFLRKQSDFFDPITGKFSQKQYEDTLSRVQLTPVQFENDLRDQIVQSQFMTGLNAGLKAPLMYGALEADYLMENRALSYVVLDPRSEPVPPKPTDAELTAFMKLHQAQLMRPEMRVLTVVRFSPKALAPTMPVDEAAVKKLYDFKKDSLSTPEKRSLVEIPAKDPASAAVAAKRLGAGEAPEAVAKALGVSVIPYTDVIKSGVADPKVAAAAFSMSVGQVSAPIHSDLGGYPVIKLTGITPATTPSLDSLRPQLEAQARADAASKKAFDGVQAYDAAHASGANLADAAKKAGFATVTVGPVSAQGAGLTGQPIPDLSPKLLKDAFNLAQGGETDSEDDGQGEYFAVKVDKVIPPGLPTLDQIRAPLTNAYIKQQIITALTAKADAIAARIKKGESLDAIAASTGLKLGHAVDVNQAGAERYTALGQTLLAQLLQAKQGEVVEGRTATGMIMVAKIDSVTPAAPGVAASALVGQRPQLSQQLAQSVDQAFIDWARRKIKPTYDIKLARAAIGVTDAASDAPAGGEKAP